MFNRNYGGTDNWGLVKKLTTVATTIWASFGCSVSVSGDTVVVGASFESSSGTAYIFGRNHGGADNWGEVRKFTASDAAIGDHFGFSVSISGDTVVVGADRKNVYSGTAYIFDRNHGGTDNWGELKKLTSSDASELDYFGWSVSVSGDIVVIGASGYNGEESGSAYVFAQNHGGTDNWGELKKLTASDASEWDYFGYSVSVSGDTVVVGAERHGTAYVFVQNYGGTDNWGEVKKLTVFDDLYFGYSVSVSGDTVVVGAYRESSGSAYVFERNHGGADNWGEVRKYTASNAAANDWFGCSVSVSGDTVVVGAYGADDDGEDSGSAYVFDNSGQVQVKKLIISYDSYFGWSVSVSGGTAVVANNYSVYVFERSQTDNWRLFRELTASDATFGNLDVSISGDTVVVGNRNDNPGSAYVFARSHGGTDNWGEVRKLTASDAAEYDWFGTSVSVSGDTVVVGDYRVDGIGSGSAYVFARNHGGTDNWGEIRKLTASDAVEGCRFGSSVSVSEDTIVVGDYYSSLASVYAGSAYVFARNHGGTDNWGEIRKLTASDASPHRLFGYSVSISKDIIVVGDSDGSGSAYVFARNQGGTDNWGEVKKLTASDAAETDNFGGSVSVSGDTVVIGASGNDDGGEYGNFLRECFRN